MKRFKDVICFFCCQGQLKQFLENYVFCQNLEMKQVVKEGEGEGHFVSVIMAQCVQKSVCDSPLIS